MWPSPLRLEWPPKVGVNVEYDVNNVVEVIIVEGGQMS